MWPLAYLGRAMCVRFGGKDLYRFIVRLKKTTKTFVYYYLFKSNVCWIITHSTQTLYCYEKYSNTIYIIV